MKKKKVLCNKKGCVHSQQHLVDGQWVCSEYIPIQKGRRPLTEYEALKLSWYRNESKWVENIKDRKMVTDRQGNRISVSQGKIMPMQPKQYWTGKVKQ